MLPHIYLIRHGQTEWSLSGQYTSHTDIPLTPKGETAARQLGERLRGVQFAHVMTSPRQRARQTCELAGLGAKAQVEADMVEWEYGDYEGKKPAELLQARPGWNLFRDGCPNGESPVQFCQRVDRFIERLRRLEGNIALISHGHFGRVLGVRWIGLPVIHAQSFLLDTASFGILACKHRLDSPVIALWNAGPGADAGV